MNHLSASMQPDGALPVEELAHRVKNHLQILATSVGIARRSTDCSSPELNRVAGHLEAFIALYQLLQAQPGAGRLDVQRYLERLCGEFVRVYLADQGITLHARISEGFLRAEICRKVALILNELTLNAAKHAFPGRLSRDVRVRLRPMSGGRWSLLVADNGRGFPLGQSAARSTETYGLSLLSRLVADIGGTCAMRSGPRGSVFVVRFSDGP